MFYELAKEIAMIFYFKCKKYPEEQLSNAFCEVLFDEAFDECLTMNQINAEEIDKKELL